MANLTIERRGLEDVLLGYQLYEVPMFAVFVGKDLKFSYRGDAIEQGIADLQQNLQSVANAGGTGIYTLKVYGDTDKDGYISNSTPYVGSFNFKLNEALPYMQGGMAGIQQYGQNSEVKILQQKIADLENKLLQTEIEEVEPAHPVLSIVDGIGAIGDKYPWLQDKLGDLFLMVRNFFKKAMPMSQNGTIAGIDPSTMQPDKKLTHAIQVLLQHDTEKKLPDRMLKLADLAMNDPDMFNVLIKKLDLL